MRFDWGGKFEHLRLIQIIERPYHVKKEYLVGSLIVGRHLVLCGESVSVEDLSVYHCILK